MFESIVVGGVPIRFLKGNELRIPISETAENTETDVNIQMKVSESVETPEVVDFDDPIPFISKLPKDFYKSLVKFP